jgi:hypothetical protein
MADNKGKRGGADRALIALTERYEAAYWAKKFKVSPAKLRYAVGKVGHSAKKVEAYLKLQKHRAADKTRIALSQPYEVRYWSTKFKITPAKLRLAVSAAGHSAKKVAAYLTDQKPAKKSRKTGATAKAKSATAKARSATAKARSATAKARSAKTTTRRKKAA